MGAAPSPSARTHPTIHLQKPRRTRDGRALAASLPRALAASRPRALAASLPLPGWLPYLTNFVVLVYADIHACCVCVCACARAGVCARRVYKCDGDKERHEAQRRLGSGASGCRLPALAACSPCQTERSPWPPTRRRVGTGRGSCLCRHLSHGARPTTGEGGRGQSSAMSSPSRSCCCSCAMRPCSSSIRCSCDSRRCCA